MANFIGKVPSNVTHHVVLDAITTSNTASYSLLNKGTPYNPINAQSLVVSLNGVTQAPGAAYTVSGSTLTFASALTSNDVIDYITAFSGALVTANIETDTVQAVNIQDNAVVTAKFPDSAVTTAKIADGNVTTAKIADNAITSAKIGVDVIVAADLAANSITVSEIQNSAVTSAKIADDAITSAKIADDAVVQAAIADDAVNEARLQVSNSPTNGHFLSAQSGNTGGLTWAEAGGGGGGYTKCDEGTVTSTAGQDNIEFTIPTGTNRILVTFYEVKTNASGNSMILQLSTSSAFKTSGYHNNSWYASGSSWTGTSYNSIGAQFTDWSNTAFFGECQWSSPDGGRHWLYKMHSSLANSTYFIESYGHVDLGSGNDCRKLRFHSTSGSGFATTSILCAYHMKME